MRYEPFMNTPKLSRKEYASNDDRRRHFIRFLSSIIASRCYWPKLSRNTRHGAPLAYGPPRQRMAADAATRHYLAHYGEPDIYFSRRGEMVRFSIRYA